MSLHDELAGDGYSGNARSFASDDEMVEVRPARIVSHAADLEHLLDAIGRATEAVERSFGPVLSPEPPEPDSRKADIGPITSPLAGHLAEMCRKAQLIERKLCSLVDRSEVGRPA